jgi:hypothetical protein
MAGIDAIYEAIEDAEQAVGPTEFSAWMGAAALVGLAKDRQSFLPDSVLRSILLRCLREADEAARGLEWGERERFERERQDLLVSPKFRRSFEELMGYDPVMSLDEADAYVGTLTVDDGDAEEHLETWLTEQGFRRNAIAYLKYRQRSGDREYEQGNWAYRREVTDELQLNVRLFDGAEPGTVDIYAHREPSIIKGEEHFGRPDYRTGVCEMQQLIDPWLEETDGISLHRLDEMPTGESPREYDCEGVDPLPSD